MCRRHGAEVHVKPCDRRLYRSIACRFTGFLPRVSNLSAESRALSIEFAKGLVALIKYFFVNASRKIVRIVSYNPPEFSDKFSTAHFHLHDIPRDKKRRPSAGFLSMDLSSSKVSRAFNSHCCPTIVARKEMSAHFLRPEIV